MSRGQRPSRGEQKRRKRAFLFRKQGGLCYYCNQPMEIVASDGKTPPPPWAATFEHLDDRWSPERGQHPFTERVVLACCRCNHHRNEQRQKEQPIEVRRARCEAGKLRKKRYG